MPDEYGSPTTEELEEQERQQQRELEGDRTWSRAPVSYAEDTWISPDRQQDLRIERDWGPYDVEWGEVPAIPGLERFATPATEPRVRSRLDLPQSEYMPPAGNQWRGEWNPDLYPGFQGISPMQRGPNVRVREEWQPLDEAMRRTHTAGTGILYGSEYSPPYRQNYLGFLPPDSPYGGLANTHGATVNPFPHIRAAYGNDPYLRNSSLRDAASGINTLWAHETAHGRYMDHSNAHTKLAFDIEAAMSRAGTDVPTWLALRALRDDGYFDHYRDFAFQQRERQEQRELEGDRIWQPANLTRPYESYWGR